MVCVIRAGDCATRRVRFWQHRRQRQKSGRRGDQAIQAERPVVDPGFTGQRGGLQRVQASLRRERERNPRLRLCPVRAAHRHQAESRRVGAQSQHGIGCLEKLVGFGRSVDLLRVQTRNGRFGQTLENTELVERDDRQRRHAHGGQHGTGATTVEKIARALTQFAAELSGGGSSSGFAPVGREE